jgi:LmbE family N-acetylglucosaminyl deacetylase
MAFGLPAGERLHVAVLSPHLDDGVLSLGASIARAVRTGHEVTVVTVFAGDPVSTSPPGRWDARAGFASAGDAARARREEDSRACGIVGARTKWLTFVDSDYADLRDADEIWAAIDAALAGAEAVLVPGRPLVHPDHAWVANLAFARGTAARQLGAYAELPYDAWPNVQHHEPPQPVVDARWRACEVSFGDRLLKWRASRAYESQLPWLGRGLGYRRAVCRSRIGGERIAWL